MNLKSYFNDKQVIFMNLVLLLLSAFIILSVILSDTSQSVVIIRNNTSLGLAGFEKADPAALYQFAIIALVIALAHTALAVRLREAKRPLAILTLGLGMVALVFLVVVSSLVLSLNR